MKISTAGRNAACDALLALLNAGSPPGHLYIRTGSPPTNVADADSGTLLATLTLSNTAFGAASSGTATAAAIASDTSVAATGTAGHFRMKNAADVTVLQGTVGTSAADLVLNSTAFTIGGTAAVSAFTVTVPIGS